MSFLSKIKAFYCDNKRDILGLSLFLFLLIATAFLFFGGFINLRAATDLPYPLFLVLSSIDIVLIVAYLFFQNKYNSIRINWVLVGLLFILFIANLFTIIAAPLTNHVFFTSVDGVPSDTWVLFNNYDKVIYVFRDVLLLLDIYLLLGIFPKRFGFDKEVMWLFYLTIAFCIITIIYSLIAEFNSYIGFFQNFPSNPYAYNPKSFFFHRNNFGLALAIGIFTSLSLAELKQIKYPYIFAGLFFVVLFFTLSKTCLALSLAIIVAFFIWKIVTTYKDNKKRNTIIVSIVGTILLTLVILAVTLLRDWLSKILFSGGGTMESRIGFWRQTIEITTDGYHIFFGHGFGYFSTVFGTMNIEHYVNNCHNLYLQTYGIGGILLATFLIGSIIYILYNAIKMRKDDKTKAFVFIVGLIAIGIFYIFEG